MHNNTYSLISLPATDLNFVSVLKRSTDGEIGRALAIMETRNGKDKGRINACKRELKRRERNEQRKRN